MKALGLALLVALLPAPAEACHRFSVWKYPWAQRCGVIPKTVPKIGIGKQTPLRVARNLATTSSPPEITLPSLLTIDWGETADDEARGRMELKALLEAK